MTLARAEARQRRIERSVINGKRRVIAYIRLIARQRIGRCTKSKNIVSKCGETACKMKIEQVKVMAEGEAKSEENGRRWTQRRESSETSENVSIEVRVDVQGINAATRTKRDRK